MRKNKWLIILLVFLLAVAAANLVQAAWIHAKAGLAQQLLMSAWNASVQTGRPVKPWSWADTWPVARLTVPARRIDMIVLDGGNGASLAFAPGHLHGSAVPGEEGISVVVAHRDTHFAFLQDVRVNERITVKRTDGREVSYRVTAMEIIDTRKAHAGFRAQASQLVLVTCYPFTAIEAGTPYRYVVTAEAVTTPVLTRM